jgi:hypothetical protein
MLDACLRSIREEDEAAARLEASKKVQQEERAKHEAEVAALRAFRDPTDVVEQVLNYTTSGNDQGTEDSFWYKPDPHNMPCVYQHTDLDHSLRLNQVAYEGLAIEAYQDPFSKTLSMAITHDGQLVLIVDARADPERVKRGWKLIYEEGHCKSLKRAF